MAKRLTTDEFIKRSKEINGDDLYDYSKVEYAANVLGEFPKLRPNGLIF